MYQSNVKMLSRVTRLVKCEKSKEFMQLHYSDKFIELLIAIKLEKSLRELTTLSTFNTVCLHIIRYS